MKEREKWIDAVKGLAIYLVVLGHTIQYATPIDYNRDANMIFHIIYSFHMPLFMLLSGYLFFYSMQKYTFFMGVKAKIEGIFIPCIVWGVITYVLDLVCYETNRPFRLSGAVHYTIYSNWFLWAVLYCSLIVLVTAGVMRRHWSMYILLLMIAWLMPEFGNMGGAKRLLPFFVLGMALNQYGIFQKLEARKGAAFLIFTLYILSMLFFDGTELITGTFGSLSVCLSIRYLCKKADWKILHKPGEVSIGIYLFSGLLFFFWIKDYMRISDDYRYLIKAGYVAGMSVLVMAVSYIVCVLVKKSRIMSKLFLGKK